ncbi:hypothetical protein D3C75_1043730 [compost metagenome]
MLVNSPGLYSPVRTKRSRMLFSLVAMISLLIGSPIFWARKPEKMLPKLPEGTLILIFLLSLPSMCR